MPPRSTSSPIAIIGAGAFGLSTALHLLQQGYTNITVFEKDTQIPPRYSAANDLNKIVRAEYEGPFYTDLAIKAIQAWKSNPLFTPHFHQTGFLHCVSSGAPQKAIDTLNAFRASAVSHPGIAPHVIALDSDDAIQSRFWQFQGKTAPFPGWSGYLNQFDGYAHSADALEGVYRLTRAAGVRFFLGEIEGAVGEIVYEDGVGGEKKAVGIRTKNECVHKAEVVIVAAGAAAGRLVSEIGTQVVAKAWSVAHVQLTDEETSALRGIPVTYARDLGFLFEPDPKTNLLKVCPMGGGVVNTDGMTGVSLPPEDQLQASAILPYEDEQRIRRLLRETLPELVERPLVHRSLCWFADTRDSDYIVDYVPGTRESVVLLSGDSGHGFKMFPIVGEWVLDLFQRRKAAQWAFKSAIRADRVDWGGDVSWRVGETKELVEVQPSMGKL